MNKPVRAATVADAGAVHATVIEAWRATVDSRSSGHRLTEPEVRDLLHAGGGFVVEDDDGVVGSVLWAREGDTVELMKLAVLPRGRGMGAGPALVDAVVQCAAEQQAAQVLLAVSRYSPRLVHWYEALGFTVDDEAVYLHASPTSPPPTVLTRMVG